MYVIGTAGHIDHGKSTLIRALTGAHPDRLKEEQERGMTIDLGFSFLELSSGQVVGVVDVPGHHRFVKNMLAGVGGVDLALFVVAATESWMPQSQEHLEIVDLLGIERGIVVLTKVDLVETEWIEMVEEEVREKLVGTVLENAPMVQVSGTAGTGIDRLRSAIEEALSDVPSPQDVGRPRLWIDRVFTVKGAGTVVTGTLQGGSIRLDDELEALPGGWRVRVRALQSHNQQLEEAPAGGRLAVNVAGAELDGIVRGNALVKPDSLVAGDCLDAVIRTVASLQRPLESESELKLHVGSAERMAKVKLLDKERVGADEQAFVQIVLDHPVAAQWQDRFVLRDPAHQETIGGGRILRAPARRVRGRDHRFHRANQSERHRVLVGQRVPERLDLELLRLRESPEVEDFVRAVIREEGWIERGQLLQLLPVAPESVVKALEAAVARNEVVALKTFVLSQPAWERLCERTHGFVREYHENFPLRSGTPRETLRSHLGIDWKLFDELLERLVDEEVLVSTGARVRLTDHEVTYSPAQQEAVERILTSLQAAPYSPPSTDELINGFEDGEEILGTLVEQGRVVRVAKGLVFSADACEEIRRQVVEHIEAEGQIDVGNMRDMLGTTRKYAVPLLEWLDQIEVTRRVGDTRVLGLKARQA